MSRRSLVVLALVLLGSGGSVLSQDGDPPFFSLDSASPSLGADSPADVFGVLDPPAFTVEVPAEALGLTSTQSIDALSGGNDHVDPVEPCAVIDVPPDNYVSTLYAWSVDRGTVGADLLFDLPAAVVAVLNPLPNPPAATACIVGGSPVPPELPPADPDEGAAGDVFVQVFNFGPRATGNVDARTRANIQWIDEEALGLADGLPDPIDDLDALESFGGALGTSDFDPDEDGDPDADVFFSVDSSTAADLGRSPADILVLPASEPASSVEIYATAAQLGLFPTDDIDALCVMDSNTEFSPIPGAPERVALSLAPGSPSLAGPDGTLGTADDFSAADVFRVGPGDGFPGSGSQVPFLPHEFLSLKAGDNLNALACLLGDPPGLVPEVPTDDPFPFPEAQIMITPEKLDFGEQPLGVTSDPQTIIIENTGTVDLTIEEPLILTGANSDDFSIVMDECSGRILGTISGEDNFCGVAISFQPASPGVRRARLQIASNDPDSPEEVALRGTNDVLFAHGFENL